MDWISLQTTNAPWVASVGWALIHSVWQLALIAIAYGGLKLAARQFGKTSNSQLLYVSGCVALLAMIALPLATLGVMLAQSNQQVTAKNTSNTTDPFSLHSNPSENTRTPELADSHLVLKEVAATTEWSDTLAVPLNLKPTRSESAYLIYVVVAWSLGVCLFSIRPIVGMLHVKSLAKRSNKPLSQRWQRVTTRIAEKLKINKAIRVVESACVQVPTVIGYFKPVVLVPAAALTGLSQKQMTLVLAHELAHIRRHDFLINLGQSVVETLLFYHPAVWWLSREIKNERENCCDDLAIQMEGDPTTLAHALLALEESRTAAPALAATGGSLSSRVKRLLNIQPDKQAPFAGLASLALAGLLISVAISAALGNTVQAQELERTPLSDSAESQHDDQPSVANPPTTTPAAREQQETVKKFEGKITTEPYSQVLAIYTTNREDAETYRQLALDNPTREYFEQLSSEVSEDKNIRTLNGAIPPISRGLGYPEIEETAFNLRRGAISKVMKIKDDWIVLYGLGVIYPNLSDAPQQVDNIIAKTYCVADLVVSPSSFLTTTQKQTETKIDAQPLIDLIQETIEPDSWPNQNLVFHEDRLCLIVSHKRSVHSQIQDLLAKLRELSEVTIETRGFLIAIPQKELEWFSLFQDKLGGEPTAISVREAAILNAVAVAKDAAELQNLPTEVLFNGQTLRVEAELKELDHAAQLALQQTVNPERNSIRTKLLVSGKELRINEPKVIDSKSGQLMAVDLSEMLELDPKRQRTILVFKSVIAQTVE